MSTFSQRVIAAGDDMSHSQSNHDFNDTSSHNSVGNNTDPGATGRGFACRFVANVPKGATIVSAFLTLTVSSENLNETCQAVIEAEDEDDPAAIADEADWHALIRTAASATWNPLPSPAVDAEINTPSLVALVQELVNRPDWVSGQHMQFLIHDDAQFSDNAASRWFYSYNNTPAKAPLLVIEYEDAGGSWTPNWAAAGAWQRVEEAGRSRVSG